MDFVTGLPTTSGAKNAIWIIVERLTKSTHFLAIKKIDVSDPLAETYTREIVRLHIVPVSVISGRDAKLTSTFC